MCGIAGFAGFGDRADLNAMLDMLVHRGPDGYGQWIDSERRVYLGHRRLAIVDIPGGAQPMFDAEGDIGVVFNGEIYNHLDLRHELEAKGYRFRSDHSDTEVLVHGFAEWGEQLPTRLNGMFAFAVYDRRRGVLFLARDRFGEKPLYYISGDGGLVFASELTAVRRHPAGKASISRLALKKLLGYGFLPAPTTLYEGIQKLPAGHTLTYEVDTGGVTRRTYWRFSVEPEEPCRSDADLAEELRALLSESVRRRLMSDVPLGIFLSGGIDSSAILVMAARHREPGSINAYSVGFQEPSYDESEFAKLVARFVGCHHHDEVLDLHAARAFVPTVLSQLDEPIADPSILPTWLLSRFARRSVTVALGGDGGDELFAGYDPFVAIPLATWYERIVKGSLHRSLCRLVDLLPHSSTNMSLDFKLRRALRGLSYPFDCRNPSWLGPLDLGEISELFQEPASPEEIYAEAIEAWRGAPSHDPVDRTLEFYTRFYLQDNILAKVDRASMIHSLEVRAPFLDNDLVEFARRLPSRYKIRGGRRKYLLKEAMKPLLPKAVINRPKKGFGIPLADWIQALPAPDGMAHVPHVNHNFWKTCFREHLGGGADHRQFLWCWYVLRYHFRQEAPLST